MLITSETYLEVQFYPFVPILFTPFISCRHLARERRVAETEAMLISTPTQFSLPQFSNKSLKGVRIYSVSKSRNQTVSSTRASLITDPDAFEVGRSIGSYGFMNVTRYSSIGTDSGALAEGLWRRASAAGAFTPMEKRAYAIADDVYEAGLFFAYLAFVPFCEAGVIDGLTLQRLFESTFKLDLGAAREYCLADDRLIEAVKFLDLGDGAGWELLQAMLNPDYRQRPIADAVLNHRFMTGSVL